MSASNEDLLKAIKNYQESLDKYTGQKNETKLLSVVQKLKKLPITTSHLETTGIGRTVNSLRKLGGEIGDAAKALVASWKDMVLEEEKRAMEETAKADSSNNTECSNSENEDERESSSSHRSGDKKSSDKHRREGKRSAETRDSDVSDRSSGDDESDNDKSYRKRKLSDSEDEGCLKSKKKPHGSDPDRDRKGSSSRSERHNSSRSASKTKSESSRKHHESSSDNDDAKAKHRKHEKHHESSTKKLHSSSRGEKSEKHDRRSEKSGDKDGRRDKSKDKHSGSRSEEKRRKSRREEESKEKTRESSKSGSSLGKKQEKSKSSGSKSREKVQVLPVNSEKIANGIGSESGASFAEALGMCGPVVSKNQTGKPAASKSSSKKKSGSCSSLSLSLGLEKQQSSVSVSESASSSTSSPKKEKRERVAEREDDIQVPKLLKEAHLEPLDPNISNLLPEITPNYKPLGLPLDHQPRRLLTEDEALSKVIYNKNARTKVYSGNKNFGKVESLFELCLRVLQDNIDALEYTGGVPYLILRPILEKATPDQLFNMEHHNPYLIEDTDQLWRFHCQKEFRNKKREELESWREMYMRCLDEREARLNAITANIKMSQDNSVPVRTTKLAYVDSVVKPPRNVARKQAKNGICARPVQTPAQRLQSLAKAGEAGKEAVPNPGSRAVEKSWGGASGGGAAATKPKKAPLMAKTLSFFKKEFRR